MSSREFARAIWWRAALLALPLAGTTLTFVVGVFCGVCAFPLLLPASPLFMGAVTLFLACAFIQPVRRRGMAIGASGSVGWATGLLILADVLFLSFHDRSLLTPMGVASYPIFAATALMLVLLLGVARPASTEAGGVRDRFPRLWPIAIIGATAAGALGTVALLLLVVWFVSLIRQTGPTVDLAQSIADLRLSFLLRQTGAVLAALTTILCMVMIYREWRSPPTAPSLHAIGLRRTR